MKIITRPHPLPALRDAHAPKGWTYCNQCQGYQHPMWHVANWRNSLGGPTLRDTIATYSKPPVTT